MWRHFTLSIRPRQIALTGFLNEHLTLTGSVKNYLAVLCGMPTIQNSARSARLSVRLFGSKLCFSRILDSLSSAFGYNSAQSEPICMKSGALWVHWLGRTDPARFWARSCTRARRNFVIFCLTHDFTDFLSAKFPEIWTQHVIGETMNPFWTEFWQFSREESFFSKKRKNTLRLQAAITPQWL